MIRRIKWRLYQCKIIRWAHSIQSIKSHLMSGLRISDVEQYLKFVRQLDVWIEAYIQAIKLCSIYVSIILSIPQRETVKSYVVTTRHRDTIILDKSCFVDFIHPISIIMYSTVKRPRRVIIRELEIFHFMPIHTRHNISGITPVGISSHYWQCLKGCLKSKRNVSIDLRRHLSGTLSLNQHNAICSSCAPNSRTILQYRYLIYIWRVKQSQRVIVITIHNRDSLILHLPDYTIHHKQRLGRKI